MAYDFLGTLTKPQYDALAALAASALERRSELVESLQKEVELQDGFAAKMMEAEGFSGGTSFVPFSGATYTPSDRDDPNIGEYRKRDESAQPPMDRALSYLLSNAPDRASFTRVPTAATGNFGGGDLPWMDVPQRPQQANPRGAYDDYRTGVLILYLKQLLLDHIRFGREQLEYPLKAALDRREQLLLKIFDIQDSEDLVVQVQQQLEDQFKQANPGEQIDDPEADEISASREGDKRLRKIGKTLPEGVRRTNLWESYPPTRQFPIWPLLPPEERGNLGKLLGTKPKVEIRRKAT